MSAGLPVVLFILGAIVVGGIFYYGHVQKVKRREELLLLATQHGLSYERQDIRGLAGLPFALFRTGDDQGVENVLIGSLNGQPFTVFDFWYMTESTDDDGHTSKSYTHFTCATANFLDDAPGWPHLQVSKEGVFSRLKDKVGFRDIDFESDEFNRMFEIVCTDRKFAFTLIDARMMQFLLMTKGAYRFEVRGTHVLVAGAKCAPAEFLTRHNILTSFVERFPDLVWGPGGTRSSPR